MREFISHSPEETHALAAEILEKLKGTPGISGTHIMAVHWESIIPRLVEEAGLLPTQTPAQV